MASVLTFDTETTGLPDWKTPSGGDNQPHLVQLGAILADEDTREVIDTLNVIIKPDGWVIPENTIEIHGISNERALAEGIPESEAFQRLMAMWAGHKRASHNRTFDQRIIRIAAKRYGTEEQQEAWADKATYTCTAFGSRPIVKLPKNKLPKLAEAYKFFTGKEIENAHTAMADAEACLAVYWGILDHQAEAA